MQNMLIRSYEWKHIFTMGQKEIKKVKENVSKNLEELKMKDLEIIDRQKVEVNKHVHQMKDIFEEYFLRR